MRPVSGGSLYVTGVIFWIRTVAEAPLAAAIDSAVLVRRSWSCARTPSSKVRIVPAMSTLSGTMFVRTPPCIMPTVTTAGVSVRSRLAARHRLDAHDDLRRRDDRIDAVPGQGAVRLPAPAP